MRWFLSIVNYDNIASAFVRHHLKEEKIKYESIKTKYKIILKKEKL